MKRAIITVRYAVYGNSRDDLEIAVGDALDFAFEQGEEYHVEADMDGDIISLGNPSFDKFKPKV